MGAESLASFKWLGKHLYRQVLGDGIKMDGCPLVYGDVVGQITFFHVV